MTLSLLKSFGLLSLLFFSFLGSAALADPPSAPSEERNATTSSDKSDQCQACIDRKGLLCADECEDVPPGRTLGCQKRCFQDYCAHRCEKDTPELKSYESPDCGYCTKNQFRLCEVHCPVGTPEEREGCQRDCAAARCSSVCREGGK